MNIPAKREPSNPEALTEWRRAKFGLFVHWGLYSIPAGIWKGEKVERLGEQIQRHAGIPPGEYAQLADRFNPVNFNARDVTRLAKRAGMKYIVFTAKHHDGFCMFKSSYTDFNVVDATPYGKDILAQLARACAEDGLRLGVYYSNPDWHFPGAVKREPEHAYAVFEPFTPEHLAYSCNQLRELLTNYGPIFEVFFDMGLPTVEESAVLAKTVYECQPNCLVSGRVMNNQGDFLTLPDNHIPANPIDQAWETPCTFYHTWGYKSWIEHPEPERQLEKQVRLLSRVVAQGGNYLLNIGPMADGTIQAYERDILEQMGDWMRVNGEAIHGTRPGPFQNLPWGQATRSDDAIYLHIHDWPANSELRLPGFLGPVVSAHMLGAGECVASPFGNGSVQVISLPEPEGPPMVRILRCTMESQVPTAVPAAPQTDNHHIAVSADVEQSAGIYNNLQYGTIVPDVLKTWDVEVTVTGTYEMEVEYQLPGEDMPLVFSVDRQTFHVLLEGDAVLEKLEPSDGNEEREVPEEVQTRRASVGRVLFAEPGRRTIKVVKDAEQIADDGIWTNADIRKSPHRGPWCLNETWTGHRREFARSSMVELTIQSIQLKRQATPAVACTSAG